MCSNGLLYFRKSMIQQNAVFSNRFVIIFPEVIFYKVF